MAHPISPAEAKAQVDAAIPDFVFETFNALIVKNLQGSTARFFHKDLCAELVLAASATSGDVVTIDQLYERNWLNTRSIAAHFRAAGWMVEYDRPGYNESYEANWSFSEQR